MCFRVEEFCALRSEITPSACTSQDFLVRVVEFCNEVLEGTRAMTLLYIPTRSDISRCVGPSSGHGATVLRLHLYQRLARAWHLAEDSALAGVPTNIGLEVEKTTTQLFLISTKK